MSADPCTTTLLQRNAELYKDAVNHPFLKSVAENTADGAFERWLTQDFHFVVAYLKFLSIILARVPSDSDASRAEGLVNGFLTAIENISKEAQFFRETSASMGISLQYTDDSIGTTTKKYIEFLMNVANEGSWSEALITLWAVEKVYLDSWSYAAETMPLNRTNKYERFIKHWANAEFEAFVGWLEKIANEVTPETTPEIENVFKTVVELEIDFWDAAIDADEEVSR